MSTEDKNLNENENEEEKKELTPIEKAYQETKSDMHKYKSERNELKERLALLEANQKAQEKASLESKEEYKILYELEKSEKEDAINKLSAKSKKFVDSSKINAVVQELGGLKKSSYSKFIEPSNIELDENGVPNEASLQAEVDRIKQSYPELLKNAQTSKMPNDAPNGNVKQTNGKLKGMTAAQLKELLNKKVNQ